MRPATACSSASPRHHAPRARVSDFTYRFGGEEFVVIAEGLDPRDGDWSLADRIRRRIAGAAAGHAGRDGHGEHRRRRLRRATAPITTPCSRSPIKRLYEAKAGGRNCIVDGRPKTPDGHVRLVAG